MKAGNNVTVSVLVTNTGTKYTADEVIQVYISWPSVVSIAPIRQLVGVVRKTIKPGDSISVSCYAESQSMCSIMLGSWYTLIILGVFVCVSIPAVSAPRVQYNGF